MSVVQDADRRGQYEIRLSGTLFNVVVAGAISVVRKRPLIRVLCGVVGVVGLLIGLFSFLLRLYPDSFLWPLAEMRLSLLAASASLIVVGVLSGPSFNLFVGDPIEVEERKVAEQAIGQSKDPYASLELDSKKLNEYYAINQSQARGSFRWAVFAMLCGFSTIIAGVWVFYFRDSDKKDSLLTGLSTVAGVVINLVSGMYLYLHNKTQKRSLLYYGQLVRVQQLGLAIRLSETHMKDDDKTAAKNRVLEELLTIIRSSAQNDVSAARTEVG